MRSFLFRQLCFAFILGGFCLTTSCVEQASTNDDSRANNGTNNVEKCSESESLCAGSCTHVLDDPLNCGMCGFACPSPNQAILTACSEGACVYNCDPGFVDADQDLEDANSNGCEAECIVSGAEICNQIDDDCDGVVDNGLPTTTYYLDEDQDGFGHPNRTRESCLPVPPAGTVINGDDCNDADSDVNPGGIEICNGQDDDCDASTSESDLEPKDCPKTQGLCAGTKVECVAGSRQAFRTGVCDAVQYGDWYESEETNCSDMRDNDCDGYTNCDDDECFNDDATCDLTLFLTSQVYNGDLDGVSGADAKCQLEAFGANSWSDDIQWKAVLSDSIENANLHIAHVRAVRAPNNSELSDSGELFTGPLINPPNILSDGTQSAGNTSVWTGSDKLGMATAGQCGGWKNASNPSPVSLGHPNTTDNWLRGGTFFNDMCVLPFRLYCISQPLTP